MSGAGRNDQPLGREDLQSSLNAHDRLQPALACIVRKQAQLRQPRQEPQIGSVDTY